MGRMVFVVIAVVGLLVSGCALNSPISANPAQDMLHGMPKLTGFLSIEDGLKEAKANFDGAIKVGITDKRIVSAQACVTSVMTDLGINPDVPAAPSFIPQTKTLLGQGSTLLIRAVQASALQGTGGLAVPQGCDAQIGQMVLDVAKANANAMPFGGLAPKLN